MSKTQLSVLTEDTWLADKMNFTLNLSGFLVGYAGKDENLLLDFIENNPMVNHILFVRPCMHYTTADNEFILRSKYKINVIIIGPPLVNAHQPLIHRSNISGYLTIKSINKETVIDLVNNLIQKGYHSNDQIPEKIWLQNPKGRQQLSSPQFTKREKEILNIVCHGFTNNEVAEVLHCTVSNIQNHIERIKSKTLVTSTVELVAISIANKWVSLSREKFKRHNPFILHFKR